MLKNIIKIITQLKLIRQEQHMSQAELANKLGWPQSHLSKIESGHVTPRLDNFVEWARVLGMEMVLVPRSQLAVINSLLAAKTGGSMDAENKPAYSLDNDDEEI